MPNDAEKRPVSPAIVTGVLRGVDLALLIGAAVLAYFTRFGDLALPGNYLITITASVLIAAYVLHAVGLYVFDDLGNITTQANRVLLGVPAVWVILVALGFLTRSSAEFSRIWVGAWFALALVGLLLVRAFLAYRVERWRSAGRLARNTVIIGAGERGECLARHFRDHPAAGVRVLAIFDDQYSRAPDKLAGYPVLGTVDDLIRFSREHAVDEVILALPWQSEARLRECLHKVETLPVRVAVYLDSPTLQLRARGIEEVAGLPLLTVLEKPLGDWDYVVKEVEDRVLAAFLLLLLLPLFLLVAIAIKLDSRGPVFFRQPRYGFNNRPFTVFKFRTMRADLPPEPEVPQAQRNDPRVTRVGRLLRRTSLDELPQLLNVLAGQMSLVGPRPHAVVHNEHYAKLIDQYLARHRMKPGITGWAQVHGLRGETETLGKMELRVAYDRYYIEHWSIWLDLRILLMTVFIVLMGRNAY